MYAVIRAGGKQYRVAPGDVIKVEKTPATNGMIEFTDVLAVSGQEGQIGRPEAGAHPKLHLAEGGAYGRRAEPVRERRRSRRRAAERTGRTDRIRSFALEQGFRIRRSGAATAPRAEPLAAADRIADRAQARRS